VIVQQLSADPSSPAPTDPVLQLYEDFHVSIYRLCMSLLHNEWDAQDAVQETFARAAQRLDTVYGSVYAYLITIARNICYRELSRRARHADTADEEVVLDAPPTEQVATERVIVRAVWDRLSPRYRMLLAYWFAGYSYDEIADRTGLSVSAVTSKLWRARQRARELGETAASVIVLPVALWRRARRALVHHVRGVGESAPPVMAGLQQFATLAAALLTSVAGGLAGSTAGSAQPVPPAEAGTATARLAAAMGVGAQPASGPADASPAPGGAASGAGRTGSGSGTPPSSPASRVDGLATSVLDPGDGAQVQTSGIEDLNVAGSAGGTAFASGPTSAECSRLTTGCPVLFVTTDGGATWVHIASQSFDGGPLLVSPSYPADPTLFAASDAGLQERRAGDSDFRLVVPGGGPAALDPRSAPGDTRILLAFAQPVVYSEASGTVSPGPVLPLGYGSPDSAAYLGHTGTVLLTAETAQSWAGPTPDGAVLRCDPGAPCSSVFSSPGETLHLAVSPDFDSDGTVVAYSPHRVYVSRDGGHSFHDATPTGLGGQYVILHMALGSVPGCASTCMLVSTTRLDGTPLGQLLVSPDGGGSYTALPITQPFGPLAILGDGHLLGGLWTAAKDGMAGLYCSRDGGTQWARTC
jgi:RNA polymerase sigma-70 factor (ECF subfamily)